MEHKKPAARSSQIVILELEDETLVYDLSSNYAHCLNETAGFVWRQCDGQNSVPDILRLVSGKYGDSVPEDFVWLALDQLSERDLLVEKVKRSKDTRTSRREMLKRVGAVTVAALPVIASLVAPSSALAQKSCACVNPGVCVRQTTCPSQNNCNGNGMCAP